MPRLRRKRNDVQFCLDANISIVEVIFITYELIGVDAHIETIRMRAPLWSDQLAKYEYDLRVWYQHPKGQLRQQKSPQHPR